MTAVQDWLNNGQMNPRNITEMLCNALFRRGEESTERGAEPTLMGRGLERC